jgi:hypothetical protein
MVMAAPMPKYEAAIAAAGARSRSGMPALARLAAISLCGLAAACSTPPTPLGPSTYLVPFAGDSTAIRPRAAMVLNNIAADANRHHEMLVEVTGSILPDPHDANPNLTALRIQEVEHALAAAGVDEDHIVRGSGPVSAARPDRLDGEQIEIRLIDKAQAPAKPVHKAQKSRN